MPQNKQRSQYNIVIIKTFGRQIAVFGQAAQNLDHLFHPEHKLRRAINYINDNLTEDVSLEAISDAVGISMYYFVQLFKQSTGFTRYQYVLQCRVERAKQLLRTTKLPIIDIALVIGCKNQSHFTKLFRKLTQTTPRQYRNGF